MQTKTSSEPIPSTEVGIWTWINLVGLLILGIVIGFVSLGIMGWNEQNKAQPPVAAQPAPVTK